jgi:hypothetical protein
MSYEKIVTLFDTAQHAEAARSNLAKAGFSTDDMSIVSGSELPQSGNALREPGLWHRLFGGEIEQHEPKCTARPWRPAEWCSRCALRTLTCPGRWAF